MTGPQHYKEAEEILVALATAAHDRSFIDVHVGVAQVHATLALAAATALTDAGNQSGDGIPPRDFAKWKTVAADQEGAR